MLTTLGWQETTATHVSSLFQGTQSHMAPEVLMEGKQSMAADVSSAHAHACMHMEMIEPLAEADSTPLSYKCCKRTFIYFFHVASSRWRPCWFAGLRVWYHSVGDAHRKVAV